MGNLIALLATFPAMAAIASVLDCLLTLFPDFWAMVANYMIGEREISDGETCKPERELQDRLQ